MITSTIYLGGGPVKGILARISVICQGISHNCTGGTKAENSEPLRVMVTITFVQKVT